MFQIARKAIIPPLRDPRAHAGDFNADGPRASKAPPRSRGFRAGILLTALTAIFATFPRVARSAENPRPASPEDVAVRQSVAALFSPEQRFPKSEGLDPEVAASVEFARVLAMDDPRAFVPAAEALLENPALAPGARLALTHHQRLLPMEQAQRLRAESRYNMAAEGANILLASPASLVQGGFAIISRTVLALGRLAGRTELTPRERKELAVLEYLLGRESRLTPEERSALSERLKALQERRRRDRAAETVERVAEALRHNRFAEADFHARRLRKLDPEAASRWSAEAEKERLAWRRRRGFALTLAPELDPKAHREELLAVATLDGPALRAFAQARPKDDPLRPYLLFEAAALMNRPGAAVGFAESLAASEENPFDGARLARELQRDAILYPQNVAQRQSDYYEERVNYYIIRGRYDLGEHAYIAAYGAVGGGAGLANLAIFHVVDVAFRWVGSFFFSPLPPEEAVDAWVQAAREPILNQQERAASLMAAAELRSWTGQHELALALVEKAAALDPVWKEELPGYRMAAAKALFQRAESSDPVEKRRAVWSAVVARYPETKSAARAREKLKELPPVLPPGTVSIEAAKLRSGGAWADLGRLLPADARLLDGNEANGEISRLEVSPKEGSARAELVDGSSLSFPPDWRLAQLLAGRAALEADALKRGTSFREQTKTQYLPLRVQGGAGAGGVDASAQLLQKPFRDRDAELYED
jgi:hypothetical protein